MEEHKEDKVLPFGSRGDWLFNKPDEPHGEVSIFRNRFLTIGGLEYKTVEHYFQSMKFFGSRYAEVVRAAASFSLAKAAASIPGARHWVRPDWNDAKEAAMMRGLVALFTQTKGLRQKLVMTGDQRIVFTRNEGYWGVGRDGKSGKNRLGVLMMRLRLAFREGRLPDDGRCTGCALEECYVGTMSAMPFTYCSPACRISLGLPEEAGKEEWVAEEAREALEAQMAEEAAAAEQARLMKLKLKTGSRKGRRSKK